jgi:hypothetical protein
VVAPRYVPRAYCAEPHLFGRATTVRWIDVAEEDRHRLRSAQLQHLYAVRIRDRIRLADRNLKDYAASVDCPYDRMSKILRGALPMRLDDIAAADIELGGISELDAPGTASSTP